MELSNVNSLEKYNVSDLTVSGALIGLSDILFNKLKLSGILAQDNGTPLSSMDVWFIVVL